MKATQFKVLALVGGLAAHSHALFGVGGHWAPAPGLELPGSDGVIASGGGQEIRLLQGGTEGMQGFGIKAWIDFLPIVDVELGANVQWAFYDVSMLFPDPANNGHDTISLAYDLGLPLVEGKPFLGNVLVDASVLYPFLKLPPLVSVAKFYVGAGLTLGLTSAILNRQFGEEALDGISPVETSQEEAEEALVEAILDEGYRQGVGMHLMLGAKVKPPVVPIAAYLNAKYYFIGTMPDAVDANRLLVLELGGALAF